MADVPLDFPVVFTVSIIMIQLIYYEKFSEPSNCVVLWSEKHFASDSSHYRSSLERAWHVMSKTTITIDYNKAFGLTKSPLFRAACIVQASSYLDGAEQAPLRAFTKQ